MNTVLDFRRSNVAGVVSRKVYMFGSWRPRSAAHVEPDVPRASERCKYFIFALLAPWNNPAKCADWNALIVINPSLLRLHLRSVAPFYANLAPIEELQSPQSEGQA